MIKLNYEKISFVEPGKIDEKKFLNIKKELEKNPSYIIDKEYVSFYEKYKTNFLYISIGIIVIIIGEIFNLEYLGLIGGFIIIMFIGELFLEGRSYATYIKKRKEYFDKMTYSITISKKYEEYISSFYN
jgi:hypothetical protein